MMIRRRIAIATVIASFSLPSGLALAQAPDAPTAAAPAQHRDTGKGAAGTKKAHAETTPAKATHAKAAHATRPAPSVAGPVTVGAKPALGGETEASSLERRRRAFFGSDTDGAAPAQDTPSAGVTLGGSGGISPGMGFKF